MERSTSFSVAAASFCSLVAPTMSENLETLERMPASKLGEQEPLAALRSCRSTPATSSAPPTLPPQQPARPVSVVVGAGPAGILSAVYLARRGHEVHVYERRPSPLEVDSSDDTRAFVVLLNSKGKLALESAGFGVPAMAAPGSGIQLVRSVQVGGGALGALRPALPEPRLVGPRHAFCAAMLAQARGMHPHAITWHFRCSFEGADVAARTATFSACPAGSPGGSSQHGSPFGSPFGSPGGSPRGSAAVQEQQEPAACVVQQPAQQAPAQHTRAYDLLVAADGGWSRVRRAAEAQVPALQCTLEPSPIGYKVFRGLPPCAALPLDRGVPAGTAASTVGVAAAGAQALPAGPEPAAGAAPQLRILFTSGGAMSQRGVLFLTCDPDSGTVRGILSMPNQLWQGQGLQGACAGAYAAFLARCFPALPAEWLLPLSAQLADHPLAPAGVRVHNTQLHAPALVLLGDAGHGVTPRTGNGMNAALQDAHVMDQLLAEPSADLSTLPERYTAARLADARALLWLDGTTTARGGSSRWGLAHPLAAASLAATLCRAVLTRATRGCVDPPAMMLMNDTQVPYSNVKAQIQRDAAMLAVATLGALGAVAAACLRRR